MTCTGKWTCDKCEHTSDNEHDPCNCDDDCCTHVETISSLRSRLVRAETERDAAIAKRDKAFKSEEVALAATEEFCHRQSMVHIRRADLAGMKARIDALTAERNELINVIYNTPLAHIGAVAAEHSTAEAIAAYCERKSHCVDRLGEPWRNGDLIAMADDIRKGSWKPSNGAS